MANDYQGSIAQENVVFTTEVVLTTSPGDNMYKLAVYIPLAEIASLLASTSGVVAGTAIVVSGSTFASIAKGDLLDILTAYYTEQTNRQAYVIVFDNDAVPTGPTLSDVYTEMKSYAYFVTMSSTTVADWVALATLQKTNSDLTAPVLVDTETYSMSDTASVFYALKTASLDAWMAYDPDASKHPIVYQLGRTLSFTNLSGTPVGNSMDFVSCSNIAAPGVNGVNLDPTEKTELETLNINYFNSIGNGTGAVAMVGGKSLNSNVMAAEWIVAYCNFVNRIKVAEIITAMNSFKNSATYFKVLQTLTDTVGLFTDTTGMGRLTGFKITAPAFKDLPKSAGGDQITVPNAWKATYVDNVRKVDVQGELTIAA